MPDLVLFRRDNPRVRRVPTGPTGAPAGYVEGAPNLVVKVRSPGTERYDLATNRRAYAQAGVPHYWLLD